MSGSERLAGTNCLEPGTGLASDDQESRCTTPTSVSPARRAETGTLAETEELLAYAAFEDTVAVIEAERRRLAASLSRSVAEPLKLLLSQANVYEQMPDLEPMARIAVSVLSSLARQALQQIRDLEASLYPADRV